MTNEFENRHFEELSSFSINFSQSRIMPLAILSGFTLSAIFFLNSIGQNYDELRWSDILGITFYVCFMLFVIASILFDIYAGQAQKLELKDLELIIKKIKKAYAK
ncbi:MAG: hypothetical protein ACW97V_17815 [Promethearchaeota archaeon]